MGLYERLQKEIHGETPSDIPPITKWVKEVEKTGRIAGWQIIALLLYDREIDEDHSDEENKHFVSEWEKQMLHWGSVRYERTGRPITPIDPVSLLPVPCGKAGKNIEWLISLGEADDVLATVGIGSASEMVKRWCDWMRDGDAQTLASATQETPPTPAPVSRWPWGNHHTEALGHLEAAAKRFWVNHDPTDNTTAPTNKEVAASLQAERKLSKTLAEAIASILRLDGLPTGPRK